MYVEISSDCIPLLNNFGKIEEMNFFLLIDERDINLRNIEETRRCIGDLLLLFLESPPSLDYK